VVRYFGPGHTGTVETIFRLAAERSPDRWDKSAMSASERKIWDELREGLGVSISVENISLDLILLRSMPKPHDTEWVERRCDVMDAFLALRMSLDSGTIHANYRDENGVQHALPAEFWRGDDVRVMISLLNGNAYPDAKSNDDLGSPLLLRLPTSELKKAWPELISRSFRESKGDETTEHGFDLDVARLEEVMPRLQGRRGRSPTVDWETIKSLLHAECKKHGGVPSLELGVEWRNQAAAENFVKDILNQRAETAAESTIRSHVAAMLRDYEADEGR
jgi:hypothetical protein